MREKRIYLATSALKSENYEAMRTIDEAKRYGFYGVQFFVNQDYKGTSYIDELADRLRKEGLRGILHLPNVARLSEEQMEMADDFALNTNEGKILIHYLPATAMPLIRGARVGWENSVDKPDTEHVDEVRRRVIWDDTFMVYDFGRQMNTTNRAEQKKVTLYIGKVLQTLRPTEDIIHVAGKKSWEGSFREEMCSLQESIEAAFLPQIREQVYQGLRIVFEHERLDLAVKSLKAL